MDKKQLTTAIIILSVTFLILFGGLLFLYFTNPALIGLEPSVKSNLNTKNQKTDDENNQGVTPTVLITLEKLIEFENTHKEKVKLDSVLAKIEEEKKKLKDTVSIKKEMKVSLNDSINNLNLKYSALNKTNSQLSDSIKKILNDYNKSKERLVLLESRIKSQEEFISRKQDTLEGKNFLDFAKMYNSTNPKDVARILEQIDERDASRILKLMQPKKASKVLEAMTPERSAAILLLGAIK